MRQLLLLRHAKSSWDDPKLDDHARPLNNRGRLAAGQLRGVMRNLGLAPDVVLVSSARRTLQTLEALEPWDETPLIEPMDSLYLAGGPQLLAVLEQVAETVRSVLLVAHNPGLHELAITLLGRRAERPEDDATLALVAGYPTGALAEFTVPGPWATVGDGHARLERFINPRDLETTPPS